MNNDLGSVYSERNHNEIQEAFARLQKLEQTPQQINSPEALESLERELRKETDKLVALLLQKHLQENLDSEEQLSKEEDTVKSWCYG
jgi:predicted  nucleic acid-binding Zn-ribbon protein